MEYKIVCCGRYGKNVMEFSYASQKSLYQWEYRNGDEYRRRGRTYARFMREDAGRPWEQFVTISNRVFTVRQLEKLLRELKDEARTLRLATGSADTSNLPANMADFT